MFLFSEVLSASRAVTIRVAAIALVAVVAFLLLLLLLLPH